MTPVSALVTKPHASHPARGRGDAAVRVPRFAAQHGDRRGKMEFDYRDYFKVAPNTGYETLIHDCMTAMRHCSEAPTRSRRAGGSWNPPRCLERGPVGPFAAIRPAAAAPAEAATLLAGDGRRWRALDTAGPAGAGTEVIAPTIIIVMGVSGSGNFDDRQFSGAGARLRFSGWRPVPSGGKCREDACPHSLDRCGSPAMAGGNRRIHRQDPRGAWTCRRRLLGPERCYRQILIGDRSEVHLLDLEGDAALIAGRLTGRHGHFMPPELLDSQFEALEEPGPEENPITVSIAEQPAAIVARIIAALRR